MSKEYLNTSKEKIAHCSDDTWICDPSNLPYQRANLDLYKNNEIVNTTTKHPLNARECIPFSRLSKYCNCAYDESRELCYRDTFCPETPIRRSDDQFEADDAEVTEPWMLAEVDDLYEWYTLPMPQPIFTHKQFEAPNLVANSFEEKMLKTKLTSDKIKRIWDKTDESGNQVPIVQDSIITVFKTASQQMICKRRNEIYTEFPTPLVHIKNEQSQDFKHLENLTKSLQDQINNCLNNNIPMKHTKHFDCNKTQLDPVLVNRKKRLYSAVLQGSDKFEPSAPQQQCRKITPNSIHQNFCIPLIIPNRLQAPLFAPPIVPINPLVVNPFLAMNSFLLQSSKRNYLRNTKSETTIFQRKTCTNYIPLKSSTSKELELEAIEQYIETLSTLEDLEQQAAEQYEDCDEN